MRRSSAALVVLTLIALLAPAPAVLRTAHAAGVATMAYVKPATATVDGQVSPGEYPIAGYYRDATTGVQAYMVHDGANMTVALVSPGLGWVAVGFGVPGVVMDGYNILMGYVSGSTTLFSDQFGVGLDHRADTSLGGQDNILASVGSESGGQTTIEFRFPLDTGDAYDARLQEGKTYGLMFAYSDSTDDLTTMHTAASLVTVTIQPDPSRIPTKHATVTLAVDGSPQEGSNVTLVMTILGENGAPYPSSELDVYVNTSVGPGLLAQLNANVSGMAALNYTLLSPGRFEFQARFPGDLDYLPTQANVTVVAARAPTPPGTLSVNDVTHWAVNVVLASVLIVYAFSMFMVVRIRRLGTRSPDARRGGPPGARSRPTPTVTVDKEWGRVRDGGRTE